MPMISSKTLINNFLLSVDKGTVSKIYSKKQTDKNGNRFWKKIIKMLMNVNIFTCNLIKKI